METLLVIVLTVFAIGCAIAINYFRGEYGGKPAEIKKEKAELKKTKQNKPIEEMTQEEKIKYLKRAEQLYNHGQIPFIVYDEIKAKCTGQASLSQIGGLDFAMATSDKIGADNALKKHQEDTTKRIITNSAIGNAFGGLAGGIASAVSTAENASAETARLISEQEKANKRFEEAVKRSGK